MNSLPPLLLLLASLALLFFAQERIESQAKELVFHRLRRAITQWISGRTSLWLLGLLSAILVQASRISAKVSGLLLERQVLSLEQAFLISLGATLGSSLKTWFFAAQMEEGVILTLLGTGAICLLWRSKPVRAVGQILASAAVFWLALMLFWQGCEPFLLPFLSHHQDLSLNIGGLLIHLWLMLLVAAVVLLLRNGTLVVYLSLQLALLNLLNLESGVVLLVGVNLGMAGLLLSRQREHTQLQRLGLIHALNRLIMGFALLFFLPYFLSVLNLLLPGNNTPLLEAFRLAAAHVLLNLLFALSGFSFYGVLARLARLFIPRAQAPPVDSPRALLMSRRVRLMLQDAPDYAMQEVQHQLQIALEHTKSITDLNLRLLTQRQGQAMDSQEDRYLFETIQQSIYDLLLPLYGKLGSQRPQQQELLETLHVLDACTRLFFLASRLHQELHRGLILDGYAFPPFLAEALQEYLQHFNTFWLNILVQPGEDRGQMQNELNRSVMTLEKRYFDFLAQERSRRDLQIWLYQILVLLRQQGPAIQDIYQAQMELRKQR